VKWYLWELWMTFERLGSEKCSSISRQRQMTGVVPALVRIEARKEGAAIRAASPLLDEVETHGWHEKVRQLVPGVLFGLQANSSLRLILVDSLPSIWKIDETRWTKTSEVVSAF